MSTTAELSFVLEGKPIGWARSRHRGRQHYTPKPQRTYRNLIQWAAMCAPGFPLQQWLALVEVDLHVVWPDRRRRDLDNVAKMVGDALNGCVFADDSQIKAWRVSSEVDRERPRIEVTVREVAT